MNSGDDDDLVVGDRVRLNAVGISRHRNFRKLNGVVVDVKTLGVVRVKFDGRISDHPVHRVLLERIVDDPDSGGKM